MRTILYVTGTHNVENMIKKFMIHPKHNHFVSVIEQLTNRDAEAIAAIIYNRRSNTHKMLYGDYEIAQWDSDYKWYDIPVSQQAIATIRQSTIDKYRELLDRQEA